MKKIILAALLAATAASADAAVTYSFAGTEFDGGAPVSGTITIDTGALAGGNGAGAPALDYYYATGDGASSTALPFLSVSFSSAGSNPTLLSAGDWTYQWLHADPADGSLSLELDWQVTNLDSTITSSRFTLSGFDLVATGPTGGALLPDFTGAGTIYFLAQSGTGANESYDTVSAGVLGFAAVPEASSWAMMVLGFGAVGYAARRRPRLTVTA